MHVAMPVKNDSPSVETSPFFCHISLTIVNGFTVKTKMICCSYDCKERKKFLKFKQEKRNHT